MSKRTESPLGESDLELRLALRAAEIGIWDWSLETNEIRYSQRARAIFGFAPEAEVTFKMVRDATHPEDHPRTSAMARSALDPQRRTREPYEYRIIRADDGEVRWVLAHGEAVFADTGTGQKAVRYVGTIQDITERKNGEEALRDAETRQRLAIDAARLAVWEVDLATERLSATPEINRLFGLPEDSRPTLDELRRHYLPGERQRMQASGEAALAQGRNHFEEEFRIRWPDGSLHWLLMRAEITFQPDGSPHRVIGVLADIDDRKRFEEQQLLMMRELNHRVKNSLSVVQSLATQTFRDRTDQQALATFRGRLQALASANDMLLNREWHSFDLRSLVESIVAPYADDDGRVVVDGPKLDMPPRLNVPLALALHELSTNAAKYGALSVETGRLNVSWEETQSGARLEWVEQGGPAIDEPLNRSFGMRLVSDIVAVELGEVKLEARPDGVRCAISMPL